MNKIQVLKLEKGEELISFILNFCQKNNINSAWFSGLGAADSAKIAFYDLKSKTFVSKNIDKSMEIASLVGNIATLNGKLVSHCHTVLSDREMKTYGGHVEELFIAATCEIILHPLDLKLTRKHSNKIGLNLLDL